MKKLILIIAVLFLTNFSYGQDSSNLSNEFGLNDKIPVDPKITIGKLDNGLKYYIRENEKPKDRALLRLVVNAGSILEKDNQQGLAHFDEHMAFNGTKNFEKQEIINYLESVGMRFGADLNAYTSFDETVYMLEIPTDSMAVVKKGFQILEDWAHNVSYDTTEINKERGVVIEEWRTRRGAAARMRDEQWPILFKNSRYAERIPIGKKEILENFKYEAATQFYKDWYRPDLMAVIAVGDFDKNKIEKLIKEHFSDLKNPKNEKERKIYPVPQNDSTLFAIATDPEATAASVSLYFKFPVKPQGRVKNYRKSLIENLYNGMMNSRLLEISQQPDPPFNYAVSQKGRLVRSSEVYYLAAAVKDTNIDKGLSAILTEAERVQRFGFTQTELKREKESMLRNIEQAYKERNKTESSQLAAEYTRNFLNDEPIPGIAYEYDLQKYLIPKIELEEINNLGEKWMEGKPVVLVSAPEKEGLEIPDENDLMAVIKEVKNSNITPYDDKVSTEPLVENKPQPAEIVEKNKIEDLNITEWTLANGVKVILKPTDFKNDQILFQGFSPGGNSLINDSLYIPAATSDAIIELSGVGKYDYIELQKKLAGKVVSVSPYIGELSEGISGSSSEVDLETMFKLIYAYFTEPRLDSSAFLSYKTKLKTYIDNRNASPEAAFHDTLENTLSQYSFRREPWTFEKLNEMDLIDSYNFYKNRFADASDFTFIFVGSFKIDSIKSLIKTYLGGLPSISRKEHWKDLNIDPPKGVITKKVVKGIEPKSRVNITFTGTSYDYNYQNNDDLYLMAEVLDIKLREVMREDKSGTYGVGVYASPQKFPDEEYSITITWGSAPDRVSELVNTVFEQIDSLKSSLVDSTYIQKVKEIILREHEVNLKENNFWLNTLYKYYFYNLDLDLVKEFPERIANFTRKDVQQAAREFFNMNNYVEVVLYPDNYDNKK